MRGKNKLSGGDLREILLTLTKISDQIYNVDVEAHNAIDQMVSLIFTLQETDWIDKERQMKRKVQEALHKTFINSLGDEEKWIF